MDGLEHAQVVNNRWPLTKIVMISGRYISNVIRAGQSS